MSPWFCKWKTLTLPIWRLELTIDKIKQNYLKSRDVAPLSQNVCAMGKGQAKKSRKSYNPTQYFRTVGGFPY